MTPTLIIQLDTAMKRLLILCLFSLQATLALASNTSPAAATNAGVFSLTGAMPLQQAVEAVSTLLDDAGYAVIDTLPISENLKRMAEKWGPDYNRNKLEGITALVFCSGWAVNQVSNLDPQLLGLCPLHVTLIHKAGTTTVLFNRPTALAKQSPARSVLLETENDVINALRSAFNVK